MHEECVFIYVYIYIYKLCSFQIGVYGRICVSAEEEEATTGHDHSPTFTYESVLQGKIRVFIKQAETWGQTLALLWQSPALTSHNTLQCIMFWISTDWSSLVMSPQIYSMHIQYIFHFKRDKPSEKNKQDPHIDASCTCQLA